jgi:hypothetical protein
MLGGAVLNFYSEKITEVDKESNNLSLTFKFFITILYIRDFLIKVLLYNFLKATVMLPGNPARAARRRRAARGGRPKFTIFTF